MLLANAKKVQKPIRIKSLRVTPEFLAVVLRTMTVKIESSLPDDIEIVGCRFEPGIDNCGNYIVLEIESAEFDEVQDDEEIPEIGPRVYVIPQFER